MSKLKKLAQDFKAFITRGNVVDMAVAVIIGSAFSAIVTALTNKILQPLINWAVACAVGGDSVGLITMLKPVYTTTELEAGEVETAIDMTNSIYIDWSAFIMAVIDFILIALVLFVIVKVFMSLQNARSELTSAENKENYKLAKQRAKEKGISKKEAYEQIVAEKKAAAEEAAKNAPAPAPTTDELLTQIRDLLAAQQANADAKAESKK